MDRQLQERLTGAAILVVLAAIFIPLILDEPVMELPPVESPPPPPAVDFDPGFRPAEDAAEEVAGEAGTAPLQGIVEAPPSSPAVAGSPPVAAKPSLPVAGSPPAAAKPSPAVAGSPPAAAKPSPPVAEPPPSSPAAADEGKGSPDDGDAWVVQVGSFARQENANALTNKLRKAGYRAFVSQLRNGGKVAYRVRVGPELSRRTAVRHRDELRRKLKIEGIIRRHP